MIGKQKIFCFFFIQINFIFFYIRSNPEDILRYFAPMKIKISTLYDNLQTALSNGNIRDVLKIEEKLKLLR
jgi:hypothetical protein